MTSPSERPPVICLVWYHYYPFEIRIQKMTASLRQAGYQVHLICRGRNGQAREEQADGVTIHRLVPAASVGPLSRMATSPLFPNPFWRWYLTRMLGRLRPDLLILKDIPLTRTALRLSAALGCALVADITENFPALMRLWPREYQQMLVYLLAHRSHYFDRLEGTLVRDAHGIITVVEESQQRLQASYCPSPKPMVVVSNTPAQMPVLAALSARPDPQATPLRLVFVGDIQPHRGLDTAIQALARLKTHAPEVHLLVAGNGPARPALEAVAAQAGVAHRVRFLGWVDDMLEFLVSGHVGLIPHPANDQWNSSIPNKLFDYMACGLPCLVSDPVPLKRIVTECRCGAVFRSGDAEDLARTIAELALDPQRMRRLGDNGRRAVEQRYNWEYDSRTLVTFCQEIMARSARRRPRQ